MKKRAIGLVDDEAVFHWIVKKYVGIIDDSCDVLSFYNGEEVFEYLNSSPERVPDILLLDINMPVCNGWKFLEDYSKSSPSENMDIYILSSSIDPEDKKKASQFEMVNDFVSKPISADFLKEALKKCG